MKLTLEQMEALESYVTLGRKPSGDVNAKEKFRAAKAVLDKAGLTKKADDISRGYDLTDALCQLARERLTQGTFAEGIEAVVANHDDAALDKLIALYDESYGGARESYPTVKMWMRAFLKAGWTPPKDKP